MRPIRQVCTVCQQRVSTPLAARMLLSIENRDQTDRFSLLAFDLDRPMTLTFNLRRTGDAKSKVEGQLVQKMEWKRTDTPFVALN